MPLPDFEFPQCPPCYEGRHEHCERFPACRCWLCWTRSDA